MLSCFKSQKTSKMILLLCGSFNPITLMHIQMFQLAKEHLESKGVEVVGGVISPVNDKYGKQGLVPQKHRVEMVKLAIQTSNWIRISEWETLQDEWTKTKNVLQHHQNALKALLKIIGENTSKKVLPSWIPENVDKETKIKLLLGADLLESFAVSGLWDKNDIKAILSNGVVVVGRQGSEPEKFMSKFDFIRKHRKKITIVQNPDAIGSEASSTLARYYISQNQFPTNLLDAAVIQYVKDNNLYKTG